ncbi:TSSK1 kinase, partial [Piaya cayana]|nr:TSSK1 kinase [Piaya cayana]
LGKKGYTLEETLGKGSQGKVKSAYCRQLKHQVAIKIIDKTKAPEAMLKKFIPREIETLTCLQHPSIIKIYETFETPSGKLYTVMELGKKGDLMNYIRTMGAMEEDVACVKFLQLASPLKHCHDSDFAHRDLKCENIILDEDLNMKLAHFGFSKHLAWDESGKTILSNTFCGTPAYSAPEVLQGVPYDPRIPDIWSLGVILYIMVYALMPFNHSNIKKMIHCQRQ